MIVKGKNGRSIIVSGALLAAAAYYTGAVLLDTHTICAFRNIFGIPCPACGMGRALLSLVRLRIAEAFYYHPLVFLLPVIFIFLFARIPDEWKKRSGIIITALILLFAAVYVVRMTGHFPHTGPMDIARNSILFRLLK